MVDWLDRCGAALLIGILVGLLGGLVAGMFIARHFFRPVPCEYHDWVNAFKLRDRKKFPRLE